MMNDDDDDGDGDEPWLAEQSMKESWFYAWANIRRLEMMQYEGYSNIHSSFLISQSDSGSGTQAMNHGKPILSICCIDGSFPGTFSSFYALCIQKGFLYLSYNSVFFLTNLFSFIFLNFTSFCVVLFRIYHLATFGIETTDRKKKKEKKRREREEKKKERKYKVEFTKKMPKVGLKIQFRFVQNTKWHKLVRGINKL